MGRLHEKQIETPGASPARVSHLLTSVPIWNTMTTDRMLYKLAGPIRASLFTISCVLTPLAAPAQVAPAVTGKAVLEKNCSGCNMQSSPMGDLDLITTVTHLLGGLVG